MPPNTTVFTPLVNHSHIVDMSQQAAEWCCAAQRAGKASGDIPTNFFLFFASQFE